MSDRWNSPDSTVELKVDIVRFIDESYPGFVECRLIDANGREWCFHDKVPVFTTAPLNSDCALPQTGVIACQVVESSIRSDGREIICVDTERPWHVEAITGETRFDVYAEQLVYS